MAETTNRGVIIQMPGLDLPPPLVPFELSVQDWEFMPLKITAVKNSDFWVSASLADRGRAVMLWMIAWEQVPVGSLPADKKVLKRLLNVRNFDPFYAVILDTFVHCSDDRYYHPTICKIALEKWESREKNKMRQRRKRDKDRFSGA